MPTIATLVVDVKARTKQFGTGMKVAIGGLALLGAGAAMAFREFDAAQQVVRQTGAVLKSTGGAAKVSAREIGDLATVLSKKSGIDDEVIRSGENMLLTFTNIRNEAGRGNKIFNQATSILTDMSVALGQDMSKSAIQLGKALNDPIKGITALRRVGVTFTDQQQDQIKAMVKSGDLLGAQKLILRELGREFAGSAAAQATGAMKAKVAFGNLMEAIGGVVAPLVNALIPAITKVAEILGKHPALIVVLASALGVLALAFVAAKIQAMLLNATLLLNPFVLIAAAAVVAAILIIKNWTKIRAFFSGLWDWIKRHWALLAAILLGPFAAVVIPIVKNWAKIRAAAQAVFDFFRGAWQGIRNLISGPFRAAFGVIVGIFQRIMGWISKVTGALGGIFRKIKGGGVPFVPGIASGGVITRTGLARVHAGEVVAGVDKLPGLAGMAGAGGPSGDVVLTIDGKAFARIARSVLLQAKGSRVTLELG